MKGFPGVHERNARGLLKELLESIKLKGILGVCEKIMTSRSILCKASAFEEVRRGGGERGPAAAHSPGGEIRHVNENIELLFD